MNDPSFYIWVCPTMGCPKWSRSIWYEDCPDHELRFKIIKVSTAEKLQQLIKVHESYEPAMDDPTRE